MTELLAIDVETGGMTAGKHALLSIAAVPSWDQEPFHALISPDPWMLVDEGARRVNGFDERSWLERGAMGIAKVLRRFQQWLIEGGAAAEKAHPLAHNAAFDRGFVDWAQQAAHVHLPLRRGPWRCSMAALAVAMDAGLTPEGSCSLDALCDLSGTTRPAVHDALADAAACLAGYQWLVKKINPGGAD